MLRVARWFFIRIHDRLQYAQYRLQRRQRISRVKKTDRNIYPLW
jgi:hypothetical protein